VRREPNPESYGEWWLTPYLRLRRGHKKRKASCRQEALWASCPVLWRRPLRCEDTKAADSYVCWTWQGREIPHADWDPRSVPILTPHQPWYKDLPREEAEKASGLLRGIEENFLSQEDVLEGSPEEALEWTLYWVSERVGLLTKSRLFAVYWRLEELLNKVDTLPEELRQEGQEYLKSLERFLRL